MSNKYLVSPGEPDSGQERNLHSCRYTSRLMAVIFISPGPHKEESLFQPLARKWESFFDAQSKIGFVSKGLSRVKVFEGQNGRRVTSKHARFYDDEPSRKVHAGSILSSFVALSRRLRRDW